jgi:hypothetical protein
MWKKQVGGLGLAVGLACLGACGSSDPGSTAADQLSSADLARVAAWLPDGTRVMVPGPKAASIDVTGPDGPRAAASDDGSPSDGGDESVVAVGAAGGLASLELSIETGAVPGIGDRSAIQTAGCLAVATWRMPDEQGYRAMEARLRSNDWNLENMLAADGRAFGSRPALPAGTAVGFDDATRRFSVRMPIDDPAACGSERLMAAAVTATAPNTAGANRSWRDFIVFTVVPITVQDGSARAMKQAGVPASVADKASVCISTGVISAIHWNSQSQPWIQYVGTDLRRCLNQGLTPTQVRNVLGWLTAKGGERFWYWWRADAGFRTVISESFWRLMIARITSLTP